MQFKNIKTHYLDIETNQYIERLYYICQSYKSFLSILARSFSDNKSKETSDMIEKYRLEYQNYDIEFNMAINTLITTILNEIPVGIQYSFDFDKREVVLKWN